MTARDYRGHTPCDYIKGNKKFIELSQHIQKNTLETL